MTARASAIFVGLSALIGVLVACSGPTVRLPVRASEPEPEDAGGGGGEDSGADAASPPDDDDDDDDDARCDAQNPCTSAREKVCSPLGICVECVVDGDCDDDKVCDASGECESPDD